jgi:hypothetical protein
MIVTEEGVVVGSINRAELEQLQGKAESEPEPEATTEVKASMASSKDELVTQAETAGLGSREDLEQFTKQELVDELNANRED